MQRPEGFSLLEMLVAFSIMAVALTIILRIFGTGANSAALTEEYATAVQISETLLARSGTELNLQAGEIQGIEAQKYHWRLLMRNAAPPWPTASADTPLFPWLLFNVTAEVSWGDDARQPRSLQLSRLQLGRVALP